MTIHKFCPLYDVHAIIDEVGSCDATKEMCPYFGDKHECGIYEAIMKHKRLFQEVRSIQRSFNELEGKIQ